MCHLSFFIPFILFLTTTDAGCPKNTHINVMTGECENCPEGFFSVGGNDAQCVACSPGTYASLGECNPCPVGTFWSLPAGIHCLPCAPGLVSLTEGSYQCTHCSKGYRPLGTSDCIKCPPGHTVSTNGTCDPCPPGLFLQDLDCTLCAPGLFAPYSGMPNCLKCKAGTEAPNLGTIECLPCAKGFYSTDNDTSICIPCNPGSTTLFEGSDTCVSKSIFSDTYTNHLDSEQVITLTSLFVIVLIILFLTVILFKHCKNYFPTSSSSSS